MRLISPHSSKQRKGIKKEKRRKGRRNRQERGRREGRQKRGALWEIPVMVFPSLAVGWTKYLKKLHQDIIPQNAESSRYGGAHL